MQLNPGASPPYPTSYVPAYSPLPPRLVPIVHHLGPHSRPGRLQAVDFRTSEGQLLTSIREELTAHIGGKPTAPQRILIDRAAMLVLRIQLMDKEQAKNAFMSEKNAREYLCWTESLSRLLVKLGMEAPAAKKSRDDAWGLETGAGL